MLRALEEPLRQIAENAGFEGSVIVDKIKKSRKEEVLTPTTNPVDMVKAGIIDPVKVTRCALQNAASIASMVLTTEALVADKKEENPRPPTPAWAEECINKKLPIFQEVTATPRFFREFFSVEREDKRNG